jgi:hypothetical protein
LRNTEVLYVIAKRVYQHVFSKSYEMYKLMENLNYFRMERISVSFGGKKKLGGSWIGFF